MSVQGRSIPAPIGGWNAKDAIENMPETDAFRLDNWFPDQGKVSMRKGYSQHSTGLEGQVESLLEFNDGATRKLVAAANSKLWDASGATASSLKTGLTNDRWEGAMMVGKLGLVNGADAPQEFDGTTMSNMTISGTGLTTTSIVGIHVFKSRSYFWMVNSASFWYSATNALGGATTEFKLDQVGAIGKIVMMDTWSRDAGDGMDDLAVFVMSSGQIYVYQGSNPGDATDWALVGVYTSGAPLSVRGKVKVGGDLILITRDGYIPLSALLSKGRFSKGSAISDKIRNAVQQATASYSGNFGWQAIYYPAGNKIIFNVPLVENQTSNQHVFNSITGAWCRFTGINANCFGSYNDDLYFGGSTIVYKADDTNADDGANIEGDATTAFSYFGSRGNLKQFTAVQPVLASSGLLPVGVSFGTDSEEPIVNINTSSFTTTGSAWDTATWDVDSWAVEATPTKFWYAVSGIGYNGAVRINIRTKNRPVDWYSTNFQFNRGGVM